MLINIEIYDQRTRTWNLNGHLELETAYKIYFTQHGLYHIKNTLEEYGVYRTKTSYTSWEWDEEFEEDFEVITTHAIRFTVSEHNKIEEAA
jgi:hypothetical protein